MDSSLQRPEEEKKLIKEMERWNRDMVTLQSLVNKGNWADDTDSKSFAIYITERICEDLQQRIQEHKSHPTIVDHNPVSVSDSDTEGIRANKRQQLDEQRMAGSKRATHKSDENSKKKQKSQDRNGELMNQIIVPKERANDDGFKWKKYGSKTISNEKYPRVYYKCASKECPGKRTVQAVDGEKVRIVYNEVHNCGAQLSLVMQRQLQQQQQWQQQLLQWQLQLQRQQQKEGIGSDQNAGLVNEAQPEQQQSPIIPQEMPKYIMSNRQPNDGVLSSRNQVQQRSTQIADNDKIRLGQYNTSLVPHLQQQRSPSVDQSARMSQSQSLDLSDLIYRAMK